jgi:hypothetical protein
MTGLWYLLMTAALFAQSAQDWRQLGTDAYTFVYPLVLLDVTRQDALKEWSSLATPPAAVNFFQHNAVFPDEKFRRIIRPNVDTLYSSAWLDLSKEPLMMQLPDTRGRFYLMQFMDAWTETFAAPGKRTTGTQEGWFAIVGPAWRGALPKGATVIQSPTNHVWLLGRTQTNTASDYEAVRAIQRGMQLMPLSQYPDGVRRPAPPSAAVMRNRPLPPAGVASMSVAAYFERAAALLVPNPPHAADAPLMERLAQAGLAPGAYRPESLTPEARREFEAGAQAAAERLARLTRIDAAPGPTGWTGGGVRAIGRYGTQYAARAVVARLGLGANPPEDAVYLQCHRDAAGQPLDGAKSYVLHFDRDQLPPVRAFWSLTVYDADGYFTANPLKRFALGDRDALRYNADGSLDLILQHHSPGTASESNWLPVPNAPFNLSLRLYWPKESVLNNQWTPPAVRMR